MKKSKLLGFFMMLMLAVALSCLFILSVNKVNHEKDRSEVFSEESYERGPDFSFAFVLISSAISVATFKLISRREKSLWV